MSLKIRPASRGHIAALRDLERRSAARFEGTEFSEIVDDEPTDAETLAARIAEGGLFIACDAEEPLAFVMFRAVDGCGYVEQIDVLPEAAGRRIGAALLDAVAGLGRARGWAALTLSTFRDIPWNAPYYRRLGFRDLAELTPGLSAIRGAHIARGLDEARRVFMRRDIDAA